MVNLTYRAERAVLGALLQDPDLLEDVRFLAAEDFQSRTHQDIFTAISSTHADRPGATGRSFELAVCLAAPGPGIDVRYLEGLTRACPDLANAAAYGRMVMEAHLRRQLLTHANRLFRDAGDLHFEVGRFSRAAGPGHGAEGFPSHLLKLAHAMWVHARGLEQASGTDAEPQPSTGPEESAVPEAPVAAASADRATGHDEQARQEEEVLADLIQHHWQNSQVLEWLPADAFTAGVRREVYEAIATLSRHEEPVDELTVEWQMARRRAAAGPTNTAGRTDTDVGGAEGQETELGYVGVLAALPVADGTAVLTGQMLLHRHTAARLDQAAAQSSERGAGQPDPGIVPPSFGAAPAARAAPAQRSELVAAPPPIARHPDQPGPRPRP
jgi:hypothetical protein